MRTVCMTLTVFYLHNSYKLRLDFQSYLLPRKQEVWERHFRSSSGERKEVGHLGDSPNLVTSDKKHS